MLDIIIFVVSFIYYHTVVRLTTYVVNLYYMIVFSVRGLYRANKDILKELVKPIKTVPDMYFIVDIMIDQYYYDWLGGAVNWFATPLITYLRTKYLKNEKFSKDCMEYSKCVKYIIDHSKLSEKYYKTEIISMLSIKPLVRYNHSIVLAYYKEFDGKVYIDIFSPYDYETTISIDDKGLLPYICSQIVGMNSEYIKYYIKNTF